jgi:hypothetical protein
LAAAGAAGFFTAAAGVVLSGTTDSFAAGFVPAAAALGDSAGVDFGSAGLAAA